jgi:hypothetical protein
VNIGVQSGLVDPAHEKAMGPAVWLYMWFVWRQTRRSGFVLGGTAFTYENIAQRSGFTVRKVRRWAEVLRKNGYIEVTRTNYSHIRIRVLKSKKFNYKQLDLNLPMDRTKNGQLSLPKTGNGSTKNGQLNKSVTLSSNETPEKEIAASPLIPLPPRNWIPLGAWLAFTRMLRKRNRLVTEDAIDLHIRDLERLRDEGNDPREVLELAVKKGWNGLYPVPKEKVNGRSREEERHERGEAANANVTGRRSGLAERLRTGFSGATDGRINPGIPTLVSRCSTTHSASSIFESDEAIEVSADSG